MSPEQAEKLSINLGFIEAQAAGPIAISALVLIVVIFLGWTLIKAR